MSNPSQTVSADTTPNSPVVKIFGVGSAGIHVVERMANGDFDGAHFTVVDADPVALQSTSVAGKILLEKKLLRGMGTGGDPERGRAAAEEQFQKLKDACAGVDVALVVAGLGGGAGTGISPVLARAAREAGALTVALVTTPFDCEGNRRQKQARDGMASLRVTADGVICVPNQKVFKLIDENTSVVDTFGRTTELVLDGVHGLWRLLKHRGLIEIHFDELCGALRHKHGECCVVAVEAAGSNRATDVAEKLFSHPLFEGEDIVGTAETVLVSLMGGPDMTMADIHRVMERVNKHCTRAQVTMGAAVENSFVGRLCVTLIVGKHAPASMQPIESSSTVTDESSELDAQLFEKKATTKPASRFVPPTPTLTSEQQTRLMGRQSATRQRQAGSKMRQEQLPLEIVNKGRFDNSEPTIYKGEDLDIPTFLRRGVVMN